MTADAALTGHHGLMLKPHTLGFFVDILVALIADLIAWLLENGPVVRGMGFVAFQAFAPGYDFMAAAGFGGQNLFMAAVAKLGNIRGQQHFMGRCMRVMAVGTVAGFDR